MSTTVRYHHLILHYKSKIHEQATLTLQISRKFQGKTQRKLISSHVANCIDLFLVFVGQILVTSSYVNNYKISPTLLAAHLPRLAARLYTILLQNQLLHTHCIKKKSIE